MAITGKYINLFTDFGFKRVFGQEANKDILMDFLNEVLPKDYTIQDLHFSKNEHLGQAVENRKAVFDIYCKSSKGEHFIVELQKARQDYFKDRSVYYASFPIQEMAKKGKTDNVEWDYQLDPVFTVGILNFAFKDNEADTDKLYHHVQLKDQDCHVFYDKLHFIYLELAKFKKTLPECKSHYEKWLWVFKNLPSLDEVPTALQEKIFVKLFNISELAKFNKKEREAYRESLKHLLDMANVVNTAFREGEAAGLEKGEVIGIEKGKAQEKAKQVVFHSLKTLLRAVVKFPEWGAQELAEFAEAETHLVEGLLVAVKSGGVNEARTFVRQQFLPKVSLDQAEEKELNVLIGQVGQAVQ